MREPIIHGVRVGWAFGFAVIGALLVTIMLTCFPYYAATLDFQFSHSVESSHDTFSFDHIRLCEQLAASITRINTSIYTHPIVMLWVAVYFGLGASKLLLHRQRLVGGVLFVCALLPWISVSITEQNVNARIDAYCTTQYERISEEGLTVINALQNFHEAHNAYPDKLELLVPQFLAKIPRTGLRVCPEYNYLGPGQYVDQPYRRAVRINSYELNVALHKVRAQHTRDMFYYLYYRPEQRFELPLKKSEQWAIESSGWVRVP